jgi:adenylosuccinate synthase
LPAYIVIGLGYGDEGKGLVTDYLARQHKASGVVRFNGGAQAAHNVVLPNGLHHTFSQFGSGTFSGTPTYLSEHMLVNPHSLFIEWDKIAETWAFPDGLLHVHRDALITTPFHIAANRVREAARGHKHGTCGMGIGETVLASKNGYEIRAYDLLAPRRLKSKLEELTHHLRLSLTEDVHKLPDRWNDKEYQKLVNPTWITEAIEVYRIFAKAVPFYSDPPWKEDETWIFEGAQGVLLDQFFGWHPHTTWSHTTPRNARELLRGSGMEPHVVGVTRSYMTRHGAGPFVTEDPSLLPCFPEAHNNGEGWQGNWRVGWPDLCALKYAIHACEGVDSLAVTHLDRVEHDWKICISYGGNEFLAPLAFKEANRSSWLRERSLALNRLRDSKPEYVESDMTADKLIGILEDATGLDVDLGSYGPTYRDMKVPLRA